MGREMSLDKSRREDIKFCNCAQQYFSICFGGIVT